MGDTSRPEEISMETLTRRAAADRIASALTAAGCLSSVTERNGYTKVWPEDSKGRDCGSLTIRQGEHTPNRRDLGNITADLSRNSTQILGVVADALRGVVIADAPTAAPETDAAGITAAEWQRAAKEHVFGHLEARGGDLVAAVARGWVSQDDAMNRDD